MRRASRWRLSVLALAVLLAHVAALDAGLDDGPRPSVARADAAAPSLAPTSETTGGPAGPLAAEVRWIVAEPVVAPSLPRAGDAVVLRAVYTPSVRATRPEPRPRGSEAERSSAASSERTVEPSTAPLEDVVRASTQEPAPAVAASMGLVPAAPDPASDPTPDTAREPAPDGPGVEPGVLLAQTTPATTAEPERPLPTYRTKPPAAATLQYRLSRGAIVGTGEIDWQGTAGSYSLQLEGRLPIVGTLLTQTSRGRIDAAGLAPERHTERRLRRGEQAANFERAAGRISFSGQSPELAVTAGVQDRVSVMIQLAAIVNAWARTPPVGERILLRVIGVRGDAHVWSLRFEGTQAVDTGEGRIHALRFLREPEAANDTRAEFWLDPARQHLPVKVLLTDGKGEPLELLRTR